MEMTEKGEEDVLAGQGLRPREKTLIDPFTVQSDLMELNLLKLKVCSI